MQNEVYCYKINQREKLIQEKVHQHERSLGVLIDAFLHTTVGYYPSIGNTLLHCHVSAVGGQSNLHDRTYSKLLLEKMLKMNSIQL